MGRLDGKVAFVTAAGRQNHVKAAVVVVVEQAHSASQRFQDGVVTGFFSISIGQLDSRFLRDIDKPDPGLRPCAIACRSLWPGCGR